MKATELLQKSKRELKEISLNPYQESLWILEEVLNLPTNALYLKKGDISEKQQKLFLNKIYRRKQGEPLEYILKEKVFFQKKFYIEQGVFIPRPETEILIHWILNNIHDVGVKGVDFGAGAGTLCLTLLSVFPNSDFAALEISHKSIECLKRNRKTFQAEKRLHILRQDVCQADKKELMQFLGEAPALIVANPPYIDSKDESISKEAYFFDPPLALFSDNEGMGHIFSWFKQAMDFLGPKGIYIFEFGWNQSEKIKEFCDKQEELLSYEIHRDSNGYPRMAVCFKK